jgi:hypothetical protein
MAVLVWATIGIAIWHFTVFLPDRFRGGIVGAFLGATFGALISGGIAQIASGDSVGQTDILTVLAAVPGCLLGLAFVYGLGVMAEAREAEPS